MSMNRISLIVIEEMCLLSFAQDSVCTLLEIAGKYFCCTEPFSIEAYL